MMSPALARPAPRSDGVCARRFMAMWPQMIPGIKPKGMMQKLPMEQMREAIASPEVLGATGAAVAWLGGRSGNLAGRETAVRCARGALARASGAEEPGFGTTNCAWHAGQVICRPQYPKSPAKCWPHAGQENL